MGRGEACIGTRIPRHGHANRLAAGRERSSPRTDLVADVENEPARPAEDKSRLKASSILAGFRPAIGRKAGA